VKKALFVDHEFHRKTRSADFFVEIVRRGFEVEIYYLDPEGRIDTGVLDAAAGADVVLLWQMDFLAPVFLAMGKPTIVIPMYDGSAGMPDLHWAYASGARFFNFSLRLNERIRLLGGETMQLRYFPPACPERELPRFDQLNAFFWQRRPDQGVKYTYIAPLIGADLTSFHLHNVPDIPCYLPPINPRSQPYGFTESRWFEKKADYEACLAACNVFVAPRATEGIGMALLEAMARGMLVLAHDAATHNEYISNGINGILYNKDVPHGPVHIHADAQRLGHMAWRTVVEGHRNWLACQPEILEWIDGAPAHDPIDIDLEHFFRDLWYSYYGSPASYEDFLHRNLAVLDRLSPLDSNKFLELVGGKSEPQSSQSQGREARLDGTGLMDLTLEHGRFTGKGWSAAEPEWRWAIGTCSELYFSGLETVSDRTVARFVAAALPQHGGGVRCKIELNGRSIYEARLGPKWREYVFSFPSDLLQPGNMLNLTFDKAKSLPNDHRELSVCFKSFRFTSDPDAALGDTVPAATGQQSFKNLARLKTFQRLLNRA
jgi:hypothetical protein